MRSPNDRTSWQHEEKQTYDAHMSTAGPPPPDPTQRRLPPTPAKPSAGAGELEPSANAGKGKNACDREEERREVSNRVADIGAQSKTSATNSREVSAADGSAQVANLVFSLLGFLGHAEIG